MPERSTVRERQNLISSSGPCTSASVALSWLFTTSLIWRVQWITTLSSCCTRSLFFAATLTSSIEFDGR